MPLVYLLIWSVAIFMHFHYMRFPGLELVVGSDGIESGLPGERETVTTSWSELQRVAFIAGNLNLVYDDESERRVPVSFSDYRTVQKIKRSVRHWAGEHGIEVVG